jgi:hypothetical protein
MTAPRFIEIDGKRHLWRDIVRLRRAQCAAAAVAAQPVLFELREDHRPASQCTAAGRYLEPSLFAAREDRRSAFLARRQQQATARVSGPGGRRAGWWASTP